MRRGFPTLPKPCLVEVAGVAGSGKSTLTRSMCESSEFNEGGFIHTRLPSHLLQVARAIPRLLPIPRAGLVAAGGIGLLAKRRQGRVDLWRIRSTVMAGGVDDVIQEQDVPSFDVADHVVTAGTFGKWARSVRNRPISRSGFSPASIFRMGTPRLANTILRWPFG